jgi:hypothetical protein
VKALTLAALAVAAVTCAHADFSYTTTSRTTGGSLAQFAGAAGNRTTKFFLKGQKMKVDSGDVTMILDFDAQTITTLNNTQKTISVKSFNDTVASAPNVDMKVDVKETGQKKTINGFSASELLMTMDVDMSQAAGGRGGIGKMQMEMDMWISPDPTGVSELRAFYQKNAARFPYSAMTAGGNPQMQSAMAEMQRKMASMNGVPVQQIVRMKQPSGAPGAAPAGAPGFTPDQAAQLAQARAKLEEMAKGGGPGAAIAQQQLARMPGGAPPAGGNSAPGLMMEMTMDSSDFSTGGIPDSVFQAPGDYRKTN